MLGTGFLTGLVAKLAGLGSAAKVAIAAATAALTMTVAGGAAGVLPFEGGHSGTGVTVTTTEPVTTVDATTSSTAGQDPGVPTGDAPVAASGGTTSPTPGAAGVGNVAGVSTPPVSIPPVSLPGGSLPDLSKLTQVPGQVLACLAPVFDLVKGLPNSVPTVSQITALGPNIVSCVSAIVADLPLPSGMNACISSISSFVRSIASQGPGGITGLGGFDVAACIPSGLPVPTGLPGGLPNMGGGFPLGH